MFNSQSDIDVKKIWNSLGSFFNQLSQQDRKHLESLWQGFIDTGEASFFNLFQANLSQYLKYAEGFIEHQDENYSVVFEDNTKQGLENVTLQYLTEPANLTVSTPGAGSKQYVYQVSAVNAQGETTPCKPEITISGSSNLSSFNNTISWDDVDGALSYNIYGRLANQTGFLTNTSLTTYIDNGTNNAGASPKITNTAILYWLFPLPDNRDYMSIPTLSGMNSGQVLQEGTDYDIVNLDKIRFNTLPNLNNTQIVKERFWAQEAISLMPSILNFYFKSIGLESPKDIVNKQQYTPKLFNWAGQSYPNKRKDYCRHLKHLVYGIVSRLRKEPTIGNLEQTYGLLADFPFSYESGMVTSVGGQNITISGNNVYTYNTGSLDILYSQGDPVNQFDILISGMQLFDYVNASGLITSYADKQGDVDMFDAFIATNTPSKDKLEILNSQDLESVKTSDKLTFVNKSRL